MNDGRPGQRDLRLAPVVAAGCLLWCAAAWLLGLRYVPGGTYANELLSTTVTVWEQHPLSAHGGLSFIRPGDFERRVAYTHGWPTHAGLLYAYLAVVRALLRVGLGEAQRLVPFLSVAALSAAYYALLASLRPAGAPPWSARRLLVVLLMEGVLLTDYNQWNIKEASPFTPYPLTIALGLGLLPGISAGRERSAGLTLYLLFLGALFPLYGLLLLAALVAVEQVHHRASQGGAALADERRRFLLRSGALGLTLVALLFYPPLIAARLGFSHGGTPTLHRMGLDGQRDFYQDHLQALLRPSRYPLSRPWHPHDPELRFAPQLLLALAAIVALGRRAGEVFSPAVRRALFVLLVPYLASLLLFPQAVSVHPYLYDVLLTVPLAVVSLLALLHPAFEERVRGLGWLLLVLLLSALVMHQLTDIAQVGFSWRGIPPLLQ